MKKSFFVSPFTFALLIAVILMVGSTVFASERQSAMARGPSDLATEQGDFRALKKELEKEYQALFRVLEESAPKIAESGELPAERQPGESPVDRRLSMFEKR